MYVTVLCWGTLYLDGHCKDSLTALCVTSRAALEAATSWNDPHMPTLDDFKWRVDVTISTRWEMNIESNHISGDIRLKEVNSLYKFQICGYTTSKLLLHYVWRIYHHLFLKNVKHMTFVKRSSFNCPCLLSSLARALQPSVLMQMKLSNGRFHRFEVFKELLVSGWSFIVSGIRFLLALKPEH